MDIALLDENKQIVMLIHWGDSWVGSKKGYFNVYFYPQNGGSTYQASGYIYSSFEKTGKLWWDEGFGGDGAIYSSIDGSGDAYPIGECDNASRVIKYVVLLGYRYSHYNLVDMRIHDINVEADLTALDPNAPTYNDGTSQGIGPEPEDRANPITEQLADQAMTCEWLDSWWPTLIIAINAAYGQFLLVLEITLDILGALGIISSDLVLAGQNPDDPVVAERIGTLSERALINTGPIGFMLSLSWFQLQIASVICINWGMFPIFLISLAQYNICVLAMLLALYHNFHGKVSVGDALTTIGSMMMTWLTLGLMVTLRTSLLRDNVQKVLERIFGDSNPGVGVFVKWCVYISVLFWVGFVFYEVAILLASQPLDATFYAPSWAL